MTPVAVALHAARRGVLGMSGLALGFGVNVGGFAAFAAGLGFGIYFLLIAIAVMGGVAAWLRYESRWFGIGLTLGCVLPLGVVWLWVLTSIQ